MYMSHYAGHKTTLEQQTIGPPACSDQFVFTEAFVVLVGRRCQIYLIKEKRASQGVAKA